MKNNYLIPVIPFEDNIIKYGKGSYIYDTEGRKLLDLNSGQFCTILGHANEELSKHIYKISQNLTHTCSSIISEEVIECSKNLHKISKNMEAYSILLSTGAEVVEFCIRYAKHITGKSGLICFNKGYHGLTLGAQSITYSGVYAKPNINNIFSIDIPEADYDDNKVQKCLDELEIILKNNSDNIAAVIIEPIVSVGGMIYPPAAYLKQVKVLCKKYNVLLIFDECQTGFGRTGEWFYFEKIDCTPDMAACAKGIGLGYPVGAALFSKDLIENNNITMTHYSSHQNDSFAASIINFGIKYINEHNLLNEVSKKGEYFLEQLKKLSSECKTLTRPRGNGLMLGIDIQIEGVADYRPIYKKVIKQSVEKGLTLQATNGGRVLRFLPSYLISNEEIDFAIKVLKEIFSDSLV